MKMKYVMMVDGEGRRLPIVFHPDISHVAMDKVSSSDYRNGYSKVKGRMKVSSAGFVETETGECSGESESLGVKSLPGDTSVMRVFLGMSKRDSVAAEPVAAWEDYKPDHHELRPGTHVRFHLRDSVMEGTVTSDGTRHGFDWYWDVRSETGFEHTEMHEHRISQVLVERPGS